LIDAALSLVTEDQDWSFSLREVSRRAGVTHNAPYNHFTDKRDLLGAVAAVGFDALRSEMSVSLENESDAAVTLVAIAKAYVRFATRNPALYRLMFGPELVAGDGTRPTAADQAGALAKDVLRQIIMNGAKQGALAIAPDDEPALEMAILATWATVHGLAMLIIDGKSKAEPVDALVEGIMRHFLQGFARH
jgi:AcrR family transcriptional regulator